MLIAFITHNRTWTWRSGRRVHHGLFGAWLAAVGLALMLDDIADRRRWRADFRRAQQG